MGVLSSNSMISKYFVFIIIILSKPADYMYSCNTGMNVLPDMYARAQEHTAPKGKCGHTYAQVSVLQLICNPSGNATVSISNSIMGCNANM